MSAFQIPVSWIPPLYSSVLKQDRNLYRPFLQPWRADEEFQRLWRRASTGMTSRIETCYFLDSLARHAASVPGAFWECGVYQGGTAIFLADIAARHSKDLHLFDTFSGMPERTEGMDSFKLGSLGETSLEFVKSRLEGAENVHFHPGMMPESFAEVDRHKIAFAHIDVDQYRSTLECCRHIYDLLSPSGIMVVDDYGRPGTPGARKAVDEFFHDMPEQPVALNTGQCFIIKQER